MKVNIVCRDYNSEKILPRKARTLADGNNWLLSDRPNGRVDLNYYFCYIEYSELFSDWHATPTAAYFTHYEEQTAFKRFFWNTAADQAGYRVCSSKKYSSILPQPVISARPPIDPIFKIQERKANSRPLIGVSGFVDRSGRKGEKLVARLASALDGSADLIASGHGWPVETRSHRLAELPGWYNSLDLFVCTSTIEGCPMTVLEALACGVPVVVPQNVGLLDEIPDTPGIFRYPVGDFDELNRAVGMAMDGGQYDREALCQAVAEYTPSNWCKDHKRGFLDALNNKKETVTKEVDRHGQRGIYYVAYGGPARQCVEGAIQSVRAHMPDIPVALVSDGPLGKENIFIAHKDEDIGGRSPKTQIYDLAPKEWEYVLYLDADTEIVAPVYYLFQLLEDGWDMVICKNPEKYHVARMMIRPDNHDECEYTFRQIGTDELIQLNGGVFAFQRNPRTDAFFHAWHNEWRRYGKRDQAALLRALFANPLKLMVLGNEWNTITRYDPPETTAGILHYPMTARRWRGVIHGRSDDPEAWRAVEEFERAQK